MNLLTSLPASVWLAFLVCGAGAAALWWWMLGAPRAARRRVLQERIAALGPVESPSEHAALHGMRDAITQARLKKEREALARHTHGDALYGIPWFLFIGDTAADVPGLLAAAHSVSPLPVAEGRETGVQAFWRWWFLDTMTAIETSPATVCEPGSRRARSLWYQALMELAEQRARLPLNGIVVCISTDSLRGDVDAVEPCAARLRHLVDEAAEYLHVQLPVYLIVTGLQRLPGYDTVRDALPPEVLTQALGHRLTAQDRRFEASDDRLSALFDPICQRLQALRLTLLRDAPSPAGKLAIHAFFDQVNALAPGLHRVIDRMFEERRGLRSSHWRGLYLTGVQPEAGGAFVSDLFRRFLPSDQPLAHG